MAGWKFTDAEVAAIQTELSTDAIGFANAHDESAVVAAFINSDGNAVVTFDTARTLLIAPSGAVITKFSPTIAGQGVKVSLLLILVEALTAVALLGLAGLLIFAGVKLMKGDHAAVGMLLTYAVIKIPTAVVAGISIAALNYQSDAGSILGEAGLMSRIVFQGIVLIAIGVAFPIVLLIVRAFQ
jgi:hypothetical protein